MTWAGLVGVAVLAAASADPARLAAAPAEVRLAEGLVARLRSPNYFERDKATRDLARLGRLAVAPLRAAADDPSAEVRGRVRALLEVAVAADTAARLDTFALDVRGEYEHGVPGWTAFRSLAGDDAEARRLFVAVVRHPGNARVLAALPAVPGQPPSPDLAPAVAARRNGVRYATMLPGAWKIGGPNPLDMAAVLLGEAVLRTDSAAFGIEYPTGNFFGTEVGKKSLLGQGEFGAAYRRLAEAWLSSRESTQGLTFAFQATNFALPAADAARYAARLVVARQAQPEVRAMAAFALARHRAVGQLPALVAVMNDPTVVQVGAPGTPAAEIRLQDCALATALVLTGQKPADFGFSGTGLAVHQGALAFRDPSAADKRAAALARWDRWAADGRGGVFGSAAVAGPDLRVPPAKP